MTVFDERIIEAVVGHMNDDHRDDNILIARAFGGPDLTSSTMVGIDAHAGVWRVSDGTSERELRVDWPGGPISERPEVRREIVALYHEACARLGVAPRSEDEPKEPASRPFSQVIREGTSSDHDSSEGAGFMASIMRGTATRQDYADLVEQHYYMYVALEEACERFATHEQFAPFYNESLVRLASIETDLALLFGDDWRESIQPVEATVAYADRITQVGNDSWIPGLVAHHYTRYLGDLSGGQMIARVVAKQHGFDGAGVEFYNFEKLGSIDDFKNDYRAALDALGESLTEEERGRMLDEVRLAYRFNTEVFTDLARRQAVRA